MKIGTMALAGVALFTIMGTAAQAVDFTYSQTFDQGYDAATGTNIPVTIAGTFSGTLAGNVVTNFSNFTLTFNGVAAAPVGGRWYTASYSQNGGFGNSGSGQLTLDNSANNVLFIDSDYANRDYGFSNYFYSVPQNSDQANSATLRINGYNTSVVSNLVIEQVGAGAVPEPAAWALMIGGFGLVGFSRRRANTAMRVTYA